MVSRKDVFSMYKYVNTCVINTTPKNVAMCNITGKKHHRHQKGQPSCAAWTMAARAWSILILGWLSCLLEVVFAALQSSGLWRTHLPSSPWFGHQWNNLPSCILVVFPFVGLTVYHGVLLVFFFLLVLLVPLVGVEDAPFCWLELPLSLTPPVRLSLFLS